MASRTAALIESLYNVPDDGKAEIVGGKLVLMSPTGYTPGRAGLVITMSLDRYSRRKKLGHVVPDNVGFVVKLPDRLSFSPDAAFFTQKPPRNLRFVEGAPAFAVEVRSGGDYGPVAEKRLADKRRDYFTAGTLVVWDVDLRGKDTVRCYRASEPETPLIYRRGRRAAAEPAVPGWRMPVDDLFNN
jgi:Uma2 family endonuclease